MTTTFHKNVCTWSWLYIFYIICHTTNKITKANFGCRGKEYALVILDTLRSVIDKDQVFALWILQRAHQLTRKGFFMKFLQWSKKYLLLLFMTLSCAFFYWNEEIFIISKLKGQNITEDDMNYTELFKRCTNLV